MSSTGSGSAATLPDVIRTYLQAHDVHDTDAALATFSAGAVITDDGRTVSGHDEIRHWLETAAREFTYERTLLDAVATGPGEWLVSTNLTGNFPGGTVDLSYRFAVDGHLIQHLVIAP